jgi:diguanylate cyclase (GGDEF)-like protein
VIRKELNPVTLDQGIKNPIRILLVEDGKPMFQYSEQVVNNGMGQAIELIRANRLFDALAHLDKERFDAVVLDLLLPDSQGIESIKRINERTNVPVIALTNSEDDGVAIEVLKAGAEDLLVKSKITLHAFHRTIHYAIARHQRLGAFQSLSLIDELTGLNNRRGFITLAEQQMKVARRENLGITLAFADLDGLKWINDHLGHIQGDLALRDVGTILKSTFRESDVMARIGGDEFAVFWTTPDALSSETLLARLKSSIDSYDISERRPYSLSLSIGFTHYPDGFTESLMEMLTESDRRMYQHKRRLTA